MNNEDGFITRLMGFGLTEKEAHCYFYLLKYGPKTPSPLAKSLHTYREDMHRTLNSLVDKGMVRPSLDTPLETCYFPTEFCYVYFKWQIVWHFFPSHKVVQAILAFSIR